MPISSLSENCYHVKTLFRLPDLGSDVARTEQVVVVTLIRGTNAAEMECNAFDSRRC